MIDFKTLKKYLSESIRSELRDYAFGDREIFWRDSDGVSMAEGYMGRDGEFTFSYKGEYFTTEDIRLISKLAKFGKLNTIIRNDRIGLNQVE